MLETKDKTTKMVDDKIRKGFNNSMTDGEKLGKIFNNYEMNSQTVTGFYNNTDGDILRVEIDSKYQLKAFMFEIEPFDPNYNLDGTTVKMIVNGRHWEKRELSYYNFVQQFEYLPYMIDDCYFYFFSKYIEGERPIPKGESIGANSKYVINDLYLEIDFGTPFNGEIKITSLQ